jgi:hypothetical protein
MLAMYKKRTCAEAQVLSHYPQGDANAQFLACHKSLRHKRLQTRAVQGELPKPQES